MIVLSKAAAEKIHELRQVFPLNLYPVIPDLGFRVKVNPGTCKDGYEMSWDLKREDDVESQQQGILVLMDPVSAIKLHGMTVDFQVTGGTATFLLQRDA